MTTLPAQMIDRWHDRAEPGPGEGAVYWHMLMKDHPQVVDLARDAQQRLARFPGLHMTPLERLHMTALLAGPADQFSQDQLRQMIKIASAMLAEHSRYYRHRRRHPVPSRGHHARREAKAGADAYS